MAIFEIKHRYTENILYACDAENLKDAVIEAAAKKADLGGAYLRGADLGGAYLRGAYLSGADLGGAYLRGADLGGADLGGAYLRGAYLSGADLSGAYLSSEKIAIAPISILNLTWDILISESYLKIGCQRHTHDEWKAFTDDEIAEMESRASSFWTSNKIWLLSACKYHRKESLAFRKANPEIKDGE
jgi:hypothetical protein